MPILVKGTSQMIYIVIFLPQIAAAFWLRHLARKAKTATLLWTIFGLVGGILAVGIFYLIQINDKLEMLRLKENENKIQTD